MDPKWFPVFDKIDRIVKAFMVGLCIFAVGYLAAHILWMAAHQ